jgi:hypothetical protein
VDELEDRNLPSGNINAYVSNGVLNINSTSPGAAVWINATGNGNVSVSPYPGFTVDHQSLLNLSGVTGAYSINLNGVDDFAFITGLKGNVIMSLTMPQTGSGFMFGNSHFTGQSVFNLGGDGSHAIAFGNDTFNGPTLINMSGGNNRIYLNTSQFGDLSMIGGSGLPNILALQDVNFHQPPLMINFGVSLSFMPSAADVTATVAQGKSVSINLAPDIVGVQGAVDLASLRITNQPSSGSAVSNGDGTVTYTSTSNTPLGPQTFTYTVKSANGITSNEGTVTVDVTGTPGPTVAISSSATTVHGDTTQANPIPYTVKFSESVTGFTASNVTVTNGTLSGFTGSGTTYTFNVTPTAGGTVTVSVAAGVVKDSSGNGNQAGSFSLTYSTIPFSLTDPSWQTLPSGVRIWDVKKGTGTAVAAGDKITVSYTGYLLNGTVFDSNSHFSTTLVNTSLIQGWVDGIPGMQPGGERRLDIPASLAYGSTGQGSIPPNADIVFDITLISSP